MSQYLTIHQTAKKGPCSEPQLRKMLKIGELPGFYSGTRFYVNYELLMELLDRESRSRMRQSNASLRSTVSDLQ